VLAIGRAVEMHEDAPAIAADSRAAGANRGHIPSNVRVFIDDFHQRKLVIAHAFERDVLAGLGDGEGLAGILAGEKPLGILTKRIPVAIRTAIDTRIVRR